MKTRISFCNFSLYPKEISWTDSWVLRGCLSEKLWSRFSINLITFFREGLVLSWLCPTLFQPLILKVPSRKFKNDPFGKNVWNLSKHSFIINFSMFFGKWQDRPKRNFYAASSAVVPNEVPFHGHFYVSPLFTFCAFHVEHKADNLLSKQKLFPLKAEPQSERETKDVHGTMNRNPSSPEGRLKFPFFIKRISNPVALRLHVKSPKHQLRPLCLSLLFSLLCLK